jgi:hypothetical protein
MSSKLQPPQAQKRRKSPTLLILCAPRLIFLPFRGDANFDRRSRLRLSLDETGRGIVFVRMGGEGEEKEQDVVSETAEEVVSTTSADLGMGPEPK